MSIITDLHLETLHANGVAELIDDNTIVIPITLLSPSHKSFAVEKRIRITYIPQCIEYIPARSVYTCEVYYHAYSYKESIECPIVKTTLLDRRSVIEFLGNNPTHY